jgi:glycosyltransferase 2 family protein
VKARLKFALKLLISVGLLVFVFQNAGIEETLQKLASANLWLVPVATTILLVAQVISAYRWKILANALGFQLAFREFLDYYLIGMYFNLFLPSAIGGDMGKMVYLAKATGQKKRKALMTLMAERGFGLFALLLLSSAACFTPVAILLPRFIPMGLVSLALLMLLGILVLRILPMKRWAIPDCYWKDTGLMARTVAVSVTVHLIAIGIHMLIASALQISVSPLYLVITYGVVSLASMTPTFNGIGAREFAYQFMLHKAGVSHEGGLAFGLYWFLVTTLASMVGGLVLIKGHYKTPSPEEMVISPLDELDTSG